jgi:hypothetical protein
LACPAQVQWQQHGSSNGSSNGSRADSAAQEAFTKEATRKNELPQCQLVLPGAAG